MKWIETSLAKSLKISYNDARSYVREIESHVVNTTLAVRSARIIIELERKYVTNAYRERRRVFRERFDVLFRVYVDAVREKIEPFRDIDATRSNLIRLRNVLENRMHDFEKLEIKDKDFCTDKSSNELTCRLDECVRAAERSSREYIVAVRRQQHRIRVEREARTKYAKAVLKRLREERFDAAQVLLRHYSNRLTETLEWNHESKLFSKILSISKEKCTEVEQILSHAVQAAHLYGGASHVLEISYGVF